jgi:hypothetical protein
VGGGNFDVDIVVFGLVEVGAAVVDADEIELVMVAGIVDPIFQEIRVIGSGLRYLQSTAGLSSYHPQSLPHYCSYSPTRSPICHIPRVVGTNLLRGYCPGNHCAIL